MNRRKVLLTEVLFLVIYSSVLYIPALSNGYAFDDVIHIQSNIAIRTFYSLVNSAFSPVYPGDLYRPVTVLSNGGILLLFGDAPFYQHTFNLLLHIGNVLLLYCALTTCRVTYPVAFAALWGSLLSHIEVVANCTGRAELLAFLFGLTSVLAAFFSRNMPLRNITSEFLVCSLLLLSAGSKESGIMWVVPVLAIRLSTKSTNTSQIVRERIRCLVPIVVVAVIYCMLRYYAFGSLFVASRASSLDNPLITCSITGRISYAFALLGRYAITAFLPLSIGADYSWGFLLPLTEPGELFPYFIVAVLLIAVSIRAWTSSRMLSLSIVWFFVAFLPTSNLIVPIGTIFGERLNYAPSIGLVFALASLIHRHTSLVWATSLVLGAITFIHAPLWRDNTTLYQHQIQISPQSIKTQVNYAVVLRNQGRLQEAREGATQALELYPDYAEAQVLLAQIAFVEGNNTLGHFHLSKAISLNPDLPDAINLAGRIALNSGDLTQANIHFQHLLKLDNNSIDGLIGQLALAITARDKATANKLIYRLNLVAPDNKEVALLTKSLE